MKKLTYMFGLKKNPELLMEIIDIFKREDNPKIKIDGHYYRIYIDEDLIGFCRKKIGDLGWPYFGRN